MNRRGFFSTLATGAAGLAAPSVSKGAGPASNFADVPAIGPNDLAAYFTEERCKRELGAGALAAPAGVEVIAYNFPSWHPSPYMEALFGRGWTEFEPLKNSKPLYPGHLFPKYPLWGWFNEADPAWAEKEIDAAADHGLDGWIVDWYWHNGTMFYHEQLENGFLKARNRSRLKFALMWANHHWKNLYPAKSPDEAAVLLPQNHSVEDCVKVIDYAIEHYFHEPNYWRLDGGLVFGIFDLALLVEALGRDGVKRAFGQMRERVAKAGLGDLHIQWNQSYAGDLMQGLKELGVDSATQYHTFGWTYGGRPGGGRSPYGDGATATVASWKKIKPASPVPFFPDCPVGWDDSPRFGTSSHMVTGRSPDQYERLCRAARHFVSGDRKKLVFLSAWNEWTEDHVLLPDSVYGYSYLEAVRRAFRDA